MRDVDLICVISFLLFFFKLWRSSNVCKGIMSPLVPINQFDPFSTYGLYITLIMLKQMPLFITSLLYILVFLKSKDLFKIKT